MKIELLEAGLHTYKGHWFQHVHRMEDHKLKKKKIFFWNIIHRTCGLARHEFWA